MQSLRTPDERFVDLPDFPFAPHYVEIDDGDGGRLRVHYLDEGPADAPPVLLMHGEPSWCFLYRTMIPVLTAAGHRVIAPDLVGFGRSDKPAERTDYTYQRHVDWMRRAVIDALDLHDATFVGQDWGGLIGLRLVAEHPDRFARVVAANTMLPTATTTPATRSSRGRSTRRRRRSSTSAGSSRAERRRRWRPRWSPRTTRRSPTRPTRKARGSSRCSCRRVPTIPRRRPNRAAWDVFREWKKPFLTAFSDKDAITRGGERVFQSIVPGAAGREHPTIAGAGHFLQEDAGPELAAGRRRLHRDDGSAGASAPGGNRPASVLIGAFLSTTERLRLAGDELHDHGHPVRAVHVGLRERDRAVADELELREPQRERLARRVGERAPELHLHRERRIELGRRDLARAPARRRAAPRPR